MQQMLHLYSSLPSTAIASLRSGSHCLGMQSTGAALAANQVSGKPDLNRLMWCLCTRQSTQSWVLSAVESIVPSSSMQGLCEYTILQHGVFGAKDGHAG